MSENLTTLNIVAAGQPIPYRIPVYNIKALVIGNESGYTCTVTLLGGDVSKTLYPSTVDWFQVTDGFKGDLVVLPTTLLTNLSSYTGASVIVDAIGLNDPEEASMYPMALPRQAVSATASGKPIFAATVGFGSTATKYQTLNIFNPPGSGVTYTFYAARCFTNDSTQPAVNLILLNGADLNLGTAVPAVSHAGSASPPVSTAHCTAEDLVVGHGGTIIEVMDMAANATQDFLDFPDSVTLQPGNNLFITLTSGTAAHVVRLTMKWSEDIYTPPAGGLMGTIATQIINQNNPAPTPVVQASPANDASIATLLTNNGQLTLGDAAWHGLLSILTGGQGDAKITGSVAGVVYLYQPLRGDIKLVYISMEAYNSAGAQSLAIPVPFTTNLLGYSGAFINADLLHNGSVLNPSVITVFNAATVDGSNAQNATIFANKLFHIEQAVDAIQINAVSGVSGSMVLIGK